LILKIKRDDSFSFQKTHFLWIVSNSHSSAAREGIRCKRNGVQKT